MRNFGKVIKSWIGFPLLHQFATKGVRSIILRFSYGMRCRPTTDPSTMEMINGKQQNRFHMDNSIMITTLWFSMC